MTRESQGTIFERIVEKFKERERRIGFELGREKGLAEVRAEAREKGRIEGHMEIQREWMAWYERQQAAQRDGRPFNEPPPALSSENRDDD